MSEQSTSTNHENRPLFDMPSHYTNGEVRMLKGFGNDKNWWLNVDYVESDDQPDFDMLRLLIKQKREAKSLS